MKRSIFIAVLGMVSASAAFGQGKIIFSNYLSSTAPKIKYNTNAALVPATKAGLAVGSGVTAGLMYYVGTSSSDIPTSLAQMTLATVTSVFGTGSGAQNADGGSAAGWFTGSVYQVPGVTASNNLFVSFDILAYIGATYAGATYSGFSSIFQTPTTVASGSGNIAMNPGAWQNFTIQSVAPVPEPATLALAGLGGLASLVALRRKKA